MSVFNIKNLSFIYIDKIVLENINLSLKKGEILAVVGESGVGKSTLLNLAAGLIEPTNGEIILEGIVLESPKSKLIAGHHDIKLVAQDYRLNPNFTVWENIAYSLRTYTKAFQNERVSELLAAFGIADLKDKLPKQISGGEKQRTAIAKAIADVPKVLLLDEPFSNLDNINKQKLKQSMTQLIKNEGIACIFVTHDLLDAIQIADNIGVIFKGKLLEIIPSNSLKNYNGNAYIEEYIKASFESVESLIN
jgi:ABC-type sugar transport system ATPase subunit